MKQSIQTKTADEAIVCADETGAVDAASGETERLREELKAEHEDRLRLAAEYQNYRRRTQQEKAEAADAGKRELVTQLLPIMDELDLAERDAEGSAAGVAEGVRMIRRRFLDILESNGFVPFDSEGARFDPERHEAFDVVPSADGNSGVVHKELRRGYFWKDKMLRPSLVVVMQ